MVNRDSPERLTVWRWSGRDRVSLHDLEFLLPAPSRREGREVVLRLRLPDWKAVSTINRRDTSYEVGAAAPGKTGPLHE
jgi:hypothetical protein